MSEHEDKELVLKAQKSPEAFSALYEKYVEKIYSYIYYKTGQNVELAEDLTAEVFTRSLKNIGNFVWQGHPYSSYLYMVARSICIEQYKKEELVDIESIAVEGDDGGDSQQSAELRLLWEKIAEMSPYVQEICHLRFVQDLSFDEIAEIVDKKPGAVRTAISRTIATLQQAYE